MQLQPDKISATKKLHLIISAIIILIAGLAYGLYPTKIFPKIFDFTAATTDLRNIFRATMGLYFGMVIFWIAGIAKEKYWVAATIANIAFMGGLATGRLISLLTDGLPSDIFLLGFIAELLLACWGLFNLNMYKKK